MKPTTWETKSSHVISVESQDIAVARLPADIRFEIETYDRMRADLSELLYEQEKLDCALQAKWAQIRDRVTALLKNSVAQTTKPQGNDHGHKEQKSSPTEQQPSREE
jgi:hypothetical protein